MEVNSKLFDELTASYKAERQKEKRKEKERDELWKRLSQLELNHKAKLGSTSSPTSMSTSPSFSPIGSQFSATGGGGLSKN